MLNHGCVRRVRRNEPQANEKNQEEVEHDKHVYIIVAGLALAVAIVFVVLAIGAYVLQPIPVQ